MSLIVIDASAMVGALIDRGPAGEWAEELLRAELASPHLLPVEVANTMRRLVRAGELMEAVAALALGDLADLGVDHLPFDHVAERVWELRENLSAYDAWYVATAELLEVPMATLDRRLARSPGPRCAFLTPP